MASQTKLDIALIAYNKILSDTFISLQNPKTQSMTVARWDHRKLIIEEYWSSELDDLNLGHTEFLSQRTQLLLNHNSLKIK